LTRFGVRIPSGVVFPADVRDAELDGLTSPVVLKAFGPGIVHKRAVGAVTLGLRTEDIPRAIPEMRRHLDERGLAPDGYLVEEQSSGDGVELLVGVV
jgi:acyl-CoA synthetase (NDP forming)